MLRPRYIALLVGAFAIAFVLIGAAAAFAGSPPVAAWSLNEDTGSVAHDSVAALNGTLSATGVNWISDGTSGSALRFSGGRVTIADSTALRQPTMAVRLWVRGDPDTPPANGQVILEKGDSNCTGGAYALVVDGGHVALRYRETYPSLQVKTLTVGASVLPSLWDGNWHLISFSSLDDPWGWVAMYQQGWVMGTESAPHALSHSGLDPANLVIGGPANASCNEASFTGDVDDVAVYSRFLPRDELAALETPVPTSVQVQSVDPIAVGATSTATVKIAPQPLAPGKLVATLLDAQDVAHGGGQVNFDGAWQLPADGVVTVPISADAAGTKLKFSWQPSLPQLPSETSVDVTVAKAGSESDLIINNTFIEDEPIDFAVDVSGYARVKADGVVDLYEVVDNVPTLVSSSPAISPVGSWVARAWFSLPARSAGTYEFEATYQGSDSFLPSDAPAQQIVVNPALVPGQVAINGGAATTDDPYVTVSVPAVGAVAIQISTDINNISKLRPPEAWAPTTTVRLTDPPIDDQDGVRTVWVRWADALNRWTDWSSDSIVLDRGLESGALTLNGGASETNTHTVSANVAVAHPDKVVSVQLSNDGDTWKTVAYAASVPWTLSSGDGQRTVRVRWVDSLGRQSVGSTDSIVVDTVAPTVSAVSIAFVDQSQPSAVIPMFVRWNGSDAGGIAGYDIGISRDGGAWSMMSRNVASPSILTWQAPGHSYKFRVRATDQAGNVGGWQPGSTLRLSAVQEKNAKITYSGTWSRSTSAGSWGGASKFSTNTGATATLRFTGKLVAWVSATGPTSGQARVYLDGHLVQTIDLWASSQVTAHVVFQHSWSGSAPHKIRIEVVGTVGHKRVDVDGFIFLT